MYINNVEDFPNEKINAVFCSKIPSKVYEYNLKYADKIRHYVTCYCVVNFRRKIFAG